MSTCSKCGARVQFRYVDGRRVPIHDGGGWKCSGSPVENAVVKAKTLARSAKPDIIFAYGDDYARPVVCSKCGASVFFVRHNGGSAWFDSLGHPWPKHACFDSDRPVSKSFLELLSHGKGGAQLGAVTALDERGRVTIQLWNGDVLKVATWHSGSDLVGQLVAWFGGDSFWFSKLGPIRAAVVDR